MGMERYKNYLNAFNAFILAANTYAYNEKLCSFVDNSKETKNSKKDLKKKATKLYEEFKKIPEELQLPELKEKIDKALNL